jgi:hypothetical protein
VRRYVTDLSPNRTAALAEFQSLVDNSWMDRGTRALAILFNTCVRAPASGSKLIMCEICTCVRRYNTNTQMASTVKITFEFTVYGRLTTSTRIRSFRINLYTAATDKVNCFARSLCVQHHNARVPLPRLFCADPRCVRGSIYTELGLFCCSKLDDRASLLFSNAYVPVQPSEFAGCKCVGLAHLKCGGVLLGAARSHCLPVS